MNFFMKIITSIVRGICYIAAKIIYRVKIEGIENVPENEACIICGNHVHALDAPALLATVNRNINFMAKEELWKSAGFRFMAKCYKVFPVRRGKNDTEAVRMALTILKKKQILGMYPEGTRNGLARGIKPKNGAVNLAIRAKVPIIPFAVIGDFKPFKKITYRFGEPMNFSKYSDQAKEKEVVDKLTQEVMEKVVELRDTK